jgi:hypothetical protein
VTKIRIYVAGPYTKPDPCINTNRAIKVGQELLEAGYAPFIPHLTYLWHAVIPNPYSVWLAYDLEWLRVCHAVLRLDGESSGADAEVTEARRLGIPVFHSIAELHALVVR